LASNTRIIRLI